MEAPTEEQSIVLLKVRESMRGHPAPTIAFRLIPEATSDQVREYAASYAIDNEPDEVMGVAHSVAHAITALEASHPAKRLGCTRINHAWHSQWNGSLCESYWVIHPSKFDFVVPRMSDDTIRQIIMDSGPVLFADEKHAITFTKANKGFVIRGSREHKCCKIAFDAKLTARRTNRKDAKERRRIADAEILLSELSWFIDTITGGYTLQTTELDRKYINPSRAWALITEQIADGVDISIAAPYRIRHTCATDYPATEAQHRDTQLSRHDTIGRIADCYHTMDWLTGHRKMRTIYRLLRASPEYRRVLRHFRKYIPGLTSDNNGSAEHRFGAFLIRELKAIRYVRVGQH